jgi:hypothetical protein
MFTQIGRFEEKESVLEQHLYGRPLTWGLKMLAKGVVKCGVHSNRCLCQD